MCVIASFVDLQIGKLSDHYCKSERKLFPKKMKM